MTDALAVVCATFVAFGLMPTVVSFLQFVLIGMHGAFNHYPKCTDYTPRVAFLLPAWNEGEVLGASIDALMDMDYPAGAWRIYVIDDASTDRTPEVMGEKTAQYPGLVFHLRREKGGQGKAHTLNHGIRAVLDEGWAEAVMIMDADVLFERSTLRRMVRHLADPEIGGVTAYVKEGSSPSNLLSRFIAFEYITAQAAARRAQNVLGAVACMAGGAQLHSRENLIAIGGAIDTSTLAEDTYATFKTQLGGKRVLIDPNAIVWAEEPDSVAALWRQRLRWARGNLQITRAFRHLWFRDGPSRGLGGWAFGFIWFSVALMPLCMILGATGLVGLYLLWPSWVESAFAFFWGVTFVIYAFQTLFAFAIDPAAAKRCWFEGIAFPGLLAIGMMGLALSGVKLAGSTALPTPGSWFWHDALVAILLAWTALSTLAAWAVYRIDRMGAPKWLRDTLLVLVGYGPLLCAVAFGAIIAELRNADLKWDKTIKSGRARIQA
jgi:cellulose synthase/poly-beta-1,6-N-acetylglucosamine synthase-like glycosyltransferase